jgi:cytochrome c peroxidase
MRSTLERLLVACVALHAAVTACGGEPSDDDGSGGGAGVGDEGGSSGGASGGNAGRGGTGTGGAEGGEGGETAGTGQGGDVTGGTAGEAGSGEAGSGAAGSGGTGGTPTRGFVWDLPPGFPTPVVPPDNRMTNEKVELGRHLFYDTRLSGNGTQACASCHRQELGFTDGMATSTGSTGEAHPRNSMTLTNVAYASTLAWANPLLFTLEDQALVPMFGTEPVELGLNGMEQELLERLRAVPKYQELFDAAYNDADPFTLVNVVRAIGSFGRTLISGNAPFDRYQAGDQSAIPESAKRGFAMTLTEKFECFHCHAGFNMQDSVNFVGKGFVESLFHNTALYNIDGMGAYPAPNTGIHEVTQDPADMGRFRAPTLRNVTVTGPYMHDGSIQTLDEVLDHYAAGGRTIPEGEPNAGVGSDNPFKSVFMVGFELSGQERADLLAFLESLTDEEFLTNPKFSNPWPQ